MQLIAKDIAAATGKHLHVVAVTHEHTDHTYGFKYAKEIFDEFTIDQLWLSWAENPDDLIAKQLKDRYGLNVRALVGAVGLLEKKNKPIADVLGSVLAFEPPEMFAAGDSITQLDYLKSQSTKKLERSEDYRHPKDAPFTLEGVPGIRIYVLGPPRNIEWIKKLEKKSELYPGLTMLDADTALAAGIFAAGGTDSMSMEDEALIQHSRPFDNTYEITKTEIQEDEELKGFFQERYGFSARRGHAPAWRRIDIDWLDAAEQLALKINSKTNNTSLVLAIELTEVDPHKVLLFVGDAQLGNWLSWHELSWTLEGDDEEKVTVEDLLRRTVLYKVGHHGSHNATLSHKGLEMMDHPELVAMIPVNEEWAYKKKDWKHPAEKLLARLKERTRHRIIRTDKIPNIRKPGKPKNVTRPEWDVLTKQLEWDRSADKLWVQYTVTE
jgi:beta-lactamase superfamily II metal-dependent hydrolase